jgi:hypothetical protein
MSGTPAAPYGLVPSRHPSGIIRIENQIDGIASGYTSSLFTGTPVTRTTDGTLIFTTGVAGTCIGVFQGCEFSAAGKRFVLPYFPAGQTYDAGTMIAKYTMDPDIIYEGQSVGSVVASKMGGGANVSGAATSGSTFTGFSTQALDVGTDATAGTFIIVGLALYADNAWGDAFTRILVQIASRNPTV